MSEIKIVLANLLDVVERMDADREAERPDEDECQHAIEQARLALGMKKPEARYIHSQSPWLHCEDVFLERHRGQMDLSEMSDRLGRSPNSIQQRMTVIGLTNDGRVMRGRKPAQRAQRSTE